MKVHEAVGKMVNRIVVNRGEIPSLSLHQSGCDRMNRSRLAEDFGEAGQALILPLIDLRGVWNEGQNMLPGQLGREDLASG